FRHRSESYKFCVALQTNYRRHPPANISVQEKLLRRHAAICSRYNPDPRAYRNISSQPVAPGQRTDRYIPRREMNYAYPATLKIPAARSVAPHSHFWYASKEHLIASALSQNRLSPWRLAHAPT